MKVYLSAALLIGAILAANAGQAVITSAPNDLTINAGSTADFIVTATNATSLSMDISRGRHVAGDQIRGDQCGA